jgi:hypothetical protein
MTTTLDQKSRLMGPFPRRFDACLGKSNKKIKKKKNPQPKPGPDLGLDPPSFAGAGTPRHAYSLAGAASRPCSPPWWSTERSSPLDPAPACLSPQDPLLRGSSSLDPPPESFSPPDPSPASSSPPDPPPADSSSPNLPPESSSPSDPLWVLLDPPASAV